MAATLQILSENIPTDAVQKREMYEATRKLYLQLEQPVDAMHRLFWSGAHLPMLQIGVDMGVFEYLSQAKRVPSQIDQISTDLQVDPILTNRIMRYFAAFGIVTESLDATYCANDTTSWLATPGAAGGVLHYLRIITPTLQALPATLQRQAYQNPSNPLDTAFNFAHNTASHAYRWQPADTSVLTAFITFMKSQRANQKSWMDSFPQELLTILEEQSDDNGVAFVDIGGSTGQQCIDLKDRFWRLRSKVILQDQEQVIAQVDKDDLAKRGITAMVHDFFTPQPVTGARIYYMRNILHDWPDDKCIEILLQLQSALSTESIVLIDENILPDIGVTWKQAQRDIQMMAALAAMERSESQWERLLAEAGLQIKQVHTYDEYLGDSIIIAGKA